MRGSHMEHALPKAPVKHGRSIVRSSINASGALRFSWMSVLLFILAAGCLRHEATAGMNADSSISGLRSRIGDLNTALAQVRSELHAGGDVTQNDKWTLRLLGLGVLMLGLTYPIGKVVWIASTALTRRATGRRDGLIPSAEDLLAFRQEAGRRAGLIAKA